MYSSPYSGGFRSPGVQSSFQSPTAGGNDMAQAPRTMPRHGFGGSPGIGASTGQRLRYPATGGLNNDGRVRARRPLLDSSNEMGKARLGSAARPGGTVDNTLEKAPHNQFLASGFRGQLDSPNAGSAVGFDARSDGGFHRMDQASLSAADAGPLPLESYYDHDMGITPAPRTAQGQKIGEDAYATMGQEQTTLGDEKRVDDRWVTVFGFPPEYASQILHHFSQYGTIIKHEMPSPGCNWINIQFQSEFEASVALSKSGRVFRDNLMLGVCKTNQDDLKQPRQVGETDNPLAKSLNFARKPYLVQSGGAAGLAPEAQSTMLNRFFEYALGW
eukprot:Clim_evm14s252 gene=Clim_evmTU14s252